MRESGLGATARVPGEPDTWEGWEDSAVPPEQARRRTCASCRRCYDKYGYDGALYGHFGQGCVHTRDRLRPRDARAGSQKYRAFVEEAADLVVSLGGSLSGEHGDGQSRGGAPAEDVRRGAGRRVPRVQGDLGSGLEDEPGQGGRSLSARREPPPRRRATRRRGRRRISASRRTRAASAAPPRRCVGVGECRREEGGACARATW